MAAGCSVFLGPVPRPLHLGEGVGAGLLRPGQPPQPLSQRPRHPPLAQVTSFCLSLSTKTSKLLSPDFPLCVRSQLTCLWSVSVSPGC